jgi:hypothetical protein
MNNLRTISMATILTLTLSASLASAATDNTLLLFGDSIVNGGYGNLVVPLIQSKYPGITHENRGISATALTDITYPPKMHCAASARADVRADPAVDASSARGGAAEGWA